MADAPAASSKASSEDLILTIFAVLLVGRIVSGLPVFLEEKLGIDVGTTQAQLGLASATIDEDTPLGTRVSAPGGAEYYTEFTSTSSAGRFLPGTSLVLKEGPERVGFKRWWRVEDGLGRGGWVDEALLVRSGSGGISERTRRGTLVRMAITAGLYNVPGGDELLGTARKGLEGVLRDGPATARGSRWWYLDSEDLDGWVSEDALVLASKERWRPGTKVVASRAADLFEAAGGGRAVGFLVEGETARIRGGPEEARGYWWLVETDDSEGWVEEEALKEGGVVGWLKGALVVLVILGGIIAAGLLAGLAYVTIRTNQIRAAEVRRIREALPKKADTSRNERWERAMENASSENPNDWRLAIIEADVMLDEVLIRLGYMGPSLGERLKSVARGDLRSLDAAWEAHKVRNQIAHAGSDMVLTKREARRVMELYAEVFRELKYI